MPGLCHSGGDGQPPVDLKLGGGGLQGVAHHLSSLDSCLQGSPGGPLIFAYFLFCDLIALAQELLPTTKYLLKDQYREEHWGVDLAAVVAKTRRGGGVLQGRQVFFDQKSSSEAEKEEMDLCEYKALVRMAGGEVVEDGVDLGGKNVLVVASGGGESSLDVDEAKMMDKKFFLRGLLQQRF